MGLFDSLKKKSSNPKPPVRPMRAPAGLRAQPEPQADNNFIIVILDSLRYDSYMAAAPKVINKLGKVEKDAE